MDDARLVAASDTTQAIQDATYALLRWALNGLVAVVPSALDTAALSALLVEIVDMDLDPADFSAGKMDAV